jgi:hypothetical protein
MSFNVNSPKSSSIPIVHGSKFSPSIDKSSQVQRSAFHISNIFQTLTKFSRNIRTNHSFVRSTSNHTADGKVSMTRRSFSKSNTLATSINRPSSCFILLSPSRQDTSTCLLFQKAAHTHHSPKVHGTSSFSKLKRVSSFLLPLKRKQSLSLNHSVHERPFKAKENSKRRSRLLNCTIFKGKQSLTTATSIERGKFGYEIRKTSCHLLQSRVLPFDLIDIDLILQVRLNVSIYNHYQLLTIDVPHWSLIHIFKSFYGIALDRQTLVFFQPKLIDNSRDMKSIVHEFIYLPCHSLKYSHMHSIPIGYDMRDPRTIRIPLQWISKINAHDYAISIKVS